ncbi:MAG: S1C family serine protease, partial [Intrasporangium sp.]|uniref:S1C family serine protease n=1 Tax=Intrasporangium sp. TaxID=1925024 RepID=UPI003F819152
MTSTSEKRTRQSGPRWWTKSTGPVSWLVVFALLGGLVGGGLVALVGWWTGWATRVQASSATTCAVDTVAADALPSVVTIAVQGAAGGGTGSGVVYRLSPSESVIVTNAHVVVPPSGRGAGTTPGPSGSAPTSLRVEYANGHSSAGVVLGMDQVTDLAVVRADTPDSAASPIAVGDSGNLRVGTPVVALGSPLGLTSTVTTGIVSATGRYVRVPTETGAAHLLGAIQTDAAINPGNSGGALVDCRAQLIGINTAGAAPAGESGSAGLGFAIPITLAQPLIAELAKNGRVAHVTRGRQVQGIPPAMQASAGGPVLVQAVTAGGPAANAGVQRGDVLVDVAGQQVR